MFLRLPLALAPILLLTACTAAFRTQSGGALAPTNASNGTSNSVILGDEGGPLSRIGMAAVGVASAAGAVQDRRTETNTWQSGNQQITQTTTTGTIDQQQAANSAALSNAAMDPNQSFSSNSGGLASTLEIASTELGGDTWGWRYFLGAAFRFYDLRGLKASGFRGSIGLSFGSFKMNRYREDDPDHLLPKEQFSNGNIGFPFRIGYMIGRLGYAHARWPLQWAEVFLKSDLNISAVADDTSPTTIGVKASYWAVYLEVGVAMIGFSDSERSLAIEGGFGF